jgi:hypothetical protein
MRKYFFRIFGISRIPSEFVRDNADFALPKSLCPAKIDGAGLR